MVTPCGLSTWTLLGFLTTWPPGSKSKSTSRKVESHALLWPSLGGHRMLMLVLSLSHVWILASPWTVAYQAPLSVGFPRQEYWSGLPSPSPGDLPDPEVKPTCPALAGRFFTTEPPEEPFTWFCFSLRPLQRPTQDPGEGIRPPPLSGRPCVMGDVSIFGKYNLP